MRSHPAQIKASAASEATGESESSEVNLGFYLSRARKDLNIRVALSGTSSARVGFPVVTSNYFGSKYLCGDTWGDAEADVICKSLGFVGGERQEQDSISNKAFSRH